MRTLTANALAEIAKKYGTEPLVIVEIHWDEGSVSYYSDKDINAQIPGKILNIGEIRTVLRPDESSGATVNVVLDDTDGSIKQILETVDIHKKSCVIYQHYADLALTDKFAVFYGQISTPFSWGEADRSLEFNVTSEIESFEVGFSPEEGQLEFVSPELVGNPWPLVFGDVLHVPATRVKQAPTAELLEPLYRADRVLAEAKIEATEEAYQQDLAIFLYWSFMRQAIRQAAPPVWWVLQEYVRVILMEDQILAQIKIGQQAVQFFTRLSQQFPNNIAFRLGLKGAKAGLQVLAKASNIIQNRKKWVEDLIGFLEHLFELDKKAVREMLNARQGLGEKQDRHEAQEQEICDQKARERTVVKVKGAENFPHLEDVTVTINNAKFLVQFDHELELMLVKSGPLITEINDCNISWSSGGCPQHSSMDSLNVFYLDPNKPVPHICGQLLFVQNKDGSHHIIRVTGQDGNKVTFDPPNRNANDGVGAQSTGSGAGAGGGGIDAIINQIVEPPGGWVQVGPFGTNIPASFFTGKFDGSVWARPEGQFLLTILATMIPWGVSKDELRNLAKLVFNLKFDILQPVIISVPDSTNTNEVTGETISCVKSSGSHASNPWIDSGVPKSEVPDAEEFRAEVGAEIKSFDDICEIYIANILPSAIKGVYAYRSTEEGIRILQEVPDTYYNKNESADLVEYSVTALTFPCPLKDIGQKWEDVVYVTMESPIGPNVADILKWLLETYTNKTVNTASHAALKAKLQKDGEELYPANFALLDRPNVLDECNRIAWESRCAIYLIGDEFHFRYISEYDDSSAPTLTEDDIDATTLQVHYTDTTDLATRSTATYNESYLPLDDQKDQPKIKLRHNIKKYGLHERTDHYHIYNIRELVYKSATFRLIRSANTWKKISFDTFATNLRLEVGDFVYIQLDKPHVTTQESVLCLVEEATYNTETQRLSLLLQTGIRTGESTQYPFYWPANEDPTQWPTDIEIEEGYAGGYGPGSEVSGTINDCQTTACTTPVPTSITLDNDSPDINIFVGLPDTTEFEAELTYEIQRDKDGEGWYSVYTGTDLEYTDVGLDPGEYTYRVKSISDICRASDWVVSEPETVS